MGIKKYREVCKDFIKNYRRDGVYFNISYANVKDNIILLFDRNVKF